jgi:AraC family transcriptional regulator, transcriptional activator of pobA
MMVDFVECKTDLPSILLIAPGQLHQVLEVNDPHGYAISFEPPVINVRLHDELRAYPRQHFFITGTPSLQDKVNIISHLLYELYAGANGGYIRQPVIELLQAMLGLIAGFASAGSENEQLEEGRSKAIEKRFRLLLHERYKTWKKPSLYAEALAISHYHLNDTVKNLTGQPLSAHIQYQSILEAKRLLYFTELTVKEISYEVGYDDPVYFSRLFKKITRVTPVFFRQQHHD